MAFLGIFLLAWVALIFFIIIGCLILFVFIPSLVIAIINLVKGVQNNWPKKNKIPFIICGSIALFFILLFVIYLSWRFGPYGPNASSSASSSVQVLLLPYLIF